MTLDQDAFQKAFLVVEDALVEMRDSRIGILNYRNGLIIRETDGTECPIVRLTTRDALKIGIEAYLNAI